MVDAAAANVVQLADSPAQVSLPAEALVLYDTPGQAVQGQVSVTITPIAPSFDPMAMPGGSYVARVPGNDATTQLIESFGAITVDLSQSGKRLQLAPGKTATIRIPLDTRSSERPATIPLYYWDETAMVWVEEGQATLFTDPTTGKQFYEGQVSHFSTWNADKPIDQTVTVTGCVKTTQGANAPVGTFRVYSEGLDYSGMAWSDNDTGTFTVAMKKGGSAKLVLLADGAAHARQLGTVNVNRSISTCWVVQGTPENAATVQAFARLLSDLSEGFELSLISIAAGDSAEDMTLSSPSQVCASGSVNVMTLDGEPVQGGERLQDNTTYRLRTSFVSCVPKPVDGETVDALDARLTGTSDAIIGSQLTGNGKREVTAVNTLTALSNASTRKAGNGTFTVRALVPQDSATQGTESLSWTPQANSTMTNLASGRTITFTSGSITTSQTNLLSEDASYHLAYKQLAYSMNGANYVLDGSIENGVGRFTLSKNGSVAATLTLSGAASMATGEVDPF